MDILDNSVNNVEVADPQDSMTDEQFITDEVDNDSQEVVEDEDSVVQDEKPIQSDEDNSKYAAARRKAQEEADIKIEAIKKEQDEFARSLGYDNFADMKSYQAKQAEDEARAKYEQAGIDPNIINELIENNPIVKQAKEIARKQQIAKDIDTLHNEIPGTEHIKNEDDLYRLDKWGDMLSLINRGYELSDAYFKVYKNEVMSKQSSAVKQKALNDINGKNHIKGDGSGVDVDRITIDPNEFKLAKTLDPTLTKEAYIKFKKSQK